MHGGRSRRGSLCPHLRPDNLLAVAAGPAEAKKLALPERGGRKKGRLPLLPEPWDSAPQVRLSDTRWRS